MDGYSGGGELLIYHVLYREDRAPEYSLFVGDLSNDIDETYLLVRKNNKIIKTNARGLIRMSCN